MRTTANEPVEEKAFWGQRREREGEMPGGNYSKTRKINAMIFFAAAPAQEPEIGLKEHLTHVQQFLNDLWAYSIDPLHEGMEGLKVAEVCDALLKAAKDNRDREYAQEQPVENSPQKGNDV